MAANTCWRCLSRPSTSNATQLPSLQLRVAPAASFSTSISLSYPPPANRSKGSTGTGPPKRGEKTTYAQKKKKKGAESKGKPPAVGERKAIRKRIVLSNTNALEVPGLTDITPETVINAEIGGTMVGLPGPLVDQLRAIDGFQPRQSWGMFRRPAMLIREDTLELAEVFKGLTAAESHNEGQQPTKDGEEAESEVSKAGEETVKAKKEVPATRAVELKRDVTRRVLVGGKGSGKSVYLLQAMAMAFLNKWTVIHIPEVRDLTIGHTDYYPVRGSKPISYTQKTYISALLQKIAKANPGLKDFELSMKHTINIPIQDKMSLDRLCQLGADPEIAHAVFVALWAELTAPGRPPVLLTMDGLNRANELSNYMSAEFKPIHAHEMFLIGWFLDHLSGKETLPNGGAVFAATSGSNTQANATLDFYLSQLEAKQSFVAGTLKQSEDLTAPFLKATGQTSNPIPQPEPFYRYDERVQGLFAGQQGKKEPAFHIKRLNGVSKDEARGLMEYWANSGMVRAEITDQLIAQKWTLAGGGVVGELERGCFKVKI